jgi:hypothetical protein
MITVHGSASTLQLFEGFVGYCVHNALCRVVWCDHLIVSIAVMAMILQSPILHTAIWLAALA